MKIKISKISEYPLPMDSWDVHRVCSLLLASAKIAKPVFSTFKWRKKKDFSLVTDADIAIEKLFAKSCDRPKDKVYLIGEETVEEKGEEYISKALKGKCWIIDPIDGTAPFACNIPTWGISIAFAEASLIMEGAIFLPSLGELYLSLDGQTYFADNIGDNDREIEFSKLPRVSANIASGALISISQDIAKKWKMTLDNPVQAICCSVFSAAGLLRGRYAALVGTMRLWDIAGSIAPLINAGFKIEILDGSKIERKISSETCLLHHSDPAMRWRYKDSLIICSEKKSVDKIRKAVKKS